MRKQAIGVLGWLTLFTPLGCTDPCLDDGLLQDDPANCAANASSGSTGNENPPIDQETEGAEATDGDDACLNGVQDGDETDVDCGGSCSAGCGVGEGCGGAQDCETQICDEDGTCQGPGGCDDGMQGDDESDADCGGACGSTCPVDGECEDFLDCEELVCDTDGECAAPNCEDGAPNGDETDVDCGGPLCDPCADGGSCDEGIDCVSGACDEGTCVPTQCTDGEQNGGETDVDCGGPDCAPCDGGESCGDGSDCASTVCDAQTCTDATCDDGVRNGAETDVDCGGGTCDACDDGQTCEDGDDCVSTLCDPVSEVCEAASCFNGIQDQGETDVDCGGPSCGPCDDGEGCEDGDDCLSEACGDGMCTAASCRDGIHNGNESDVDCGGDTCGPCDDGESCLLTTDCTSTVCLMEVCQPPSCTDGTQNGSETDEDCGGECGSTCETDEGCGDALDCVSLVCDDATNTCAAPTCEDGAPNGNETDVDCGGPDCPACAAPGNCEVPTDCISGVCDENQCVPPSCDDGVLNGTETDIDCGGDACAPCDGGEMCLETTDCVSEVCDAGTCSDASCDDGVQNQGETDVDCGGANCDPCDDGEGCDVGTDCESVSCDPVAEVCEAPTCNDGVQNGGETGNDCGGPECGGCDPGEGCTADTDCLSMVCDEMAGTCVAPTCDDGVVNGDESDLDCGGPDCDACDDGDDCVFSADCMSMVCLMETCQPSACDDGVHNGDETDVDCGGSCQPCDDGQGCGIPGDCDSGVCEADTCAEATCDDSVQNGSETGEDCGGPDCDACPPGGGCVGNDDCDSGVCDPGTNTCLAPACDDGVLNGTETDVDCGGDACPACDTGETCDDGDDCVSGGCTGNACNAPLSVVITPNACGDAADDGFVSFTAVADGGTGGPYAYSWAPDDGTVATPDAASTDITPTDYASYTVTADDGADTASAVGVVVISNSAFNLQENCTLYQGDLLGSTPDASITYSAGGTVATEAGNNDLGLHLCEGVAFTNTRLTGSFAVNTGGDDDFAGFVWGAQDNSHFYVMAWKQSQQNSSDFGVTCDSGVFETGMVVKRVFAPTFDDLTMADIYCGNDTANSELLLSPAESVSVGWLDNTDYTIEIDFLQTGSSVSVTNDDTATLVDTFDVTDSTYIDGFFGSHTISQAAVEVGPMFGSCL